MEGVSKCSALERLKRHPVGLALCVGSCLDPWGGATTVRCAQVRSVAEDLG